VAIGEARDKRMAIREAYTINKPGAKKKADVVRRPKAFDHVGLLYNGLPGEPGNPSSSHPTETNFVFDKGFDIEL
jgi:hypothetical protein